VNSLNCDVCKSLKEEYDNALKFEALAYGRLIAHKRRHETTQASENSMRHLRLVNYIAKRYEEGAFNAHPEVPPE